MTTGEDPNINPDRPNDCQELAEWVAETDANLAAAVAELEENPPIIFDDTKSILDAVEKAARLAGRREILDELKERIEN